MPVSLTDGNRTLSFPSYTITAKLPLAFNGSLFCVCVQSICVPDLVAKQHPGLPNYPPSPMR